jgi:hypothetical protein
MTGSVADIWARSPVAVSLEQISDTNLAKDELLDYASNKKNVILIMNQ